MAYRGNPQYYRSWNASALGLKTEGPEEPNKIDGLLSKDRQRPRRESWSQPPQRGRGSLRGKGTWYIDNRPQNRRRYTMPDTQDYSSYHANDEPSDYNQLKDNPIIEEPRNLSVSPESDYSDFKTKENGGEKYDYQDETPSWDRKQYSSDNIYRPPRSRSSSWHWKSNSSSDDGSQSRGYSNDSSKKYESENYKAQRKNSWEREPDQTWVHDKFEHLDSDFDQKHKKHKKDKKDKKEKKEKKDASTQVTPIDINNELNKIKNKNNIESGFFKKIDKPESPKDQANPSTLPKEITIKFSELMKESNDENPESIIPQTLDSKNEELSIEPEIASEAKFEEVHPKAEVTPEVTPEVPLEVSPEVIIPPEATPEVAPGEVTPEVTPDEVTHEVTSKVTPDEVTHEVTSKVTPDEVTHEVTSKVTPDEVTHEVTSKVTPDEVTHEVTSKVTPDEVTHEVTPEVTSEVTPEVTPESPKKEELQIQILINLDEDINTGIQPIQPKISEDIYALDWGSYQKTLFEEELRLNMEQPVKMPTPHKLDTGLKDFDSLL